jgi:cytochrome c-type biogenesis protein CcmH/NrfG
MLTLVVVVVVFGVHSTVDWTWFVPANAGVAVLCAGWVAGRGPLRARLAAPDGPPGPERMLWPHAGRLARLGQRVPPLRALAVGIVIALALAASWTAYQPVRAVHAGDEAFERLDQGQPEAAADIARIATERNPLSVDPLFELAAIEEARGQTAEAEAALERAVDLQPASAEAWRRLGRFRLSALNDAQGALSAFQAAYFLDPRSPASTSDVVEASRAATTPAEPAP